MQETLTKQRVQVEPYHSRLRWKEEVLRGVVTILFGLLIPFTLNIFIAALGIYLVLDGALDLIITRRRETPRTFLTYLIGLVSIALGVISLVAPRATLFLIVVVISTRMIFRSLRVIIDARRSRHTYAGFTWLFGILLLLVGLALLSNAFLSVLEHSLPYSLIIVVLFMSAYALVDGVYLLGRTDPRAFWYYFPVLLTIKLSLPLLVAPLALGLINRRSLVNWACLAAATLLLFSLVCRVQIGVRLVLPLVALAIVGVRRGLVAAALFVLLSPAIRLADWLLLPGLHALQYQSFWTIGDAIAIGCLLAKLRPELAANRRSHRTC